MPFLSYIKQLEFVNKIYDTDEREYELSKLLFGISRIIIDNYDINSKFSFIVTKELKDSYLDLFNIVREDNRICFISNSEKKDSLIITIDNNQVSKLVYENNNSRVKLLKKDNYISLSNSVILEDGSLNEEVFRYKISNDKIYQKSYELRSISKNNNSSDELSFEYSYDTRLNRMVKTTSKIVLEDNKVISNSRREELVNQEDYLLQNGVFCIFDRKKSLKFRKDK